MADGSVGYRWLQGMVSASLLGLEVRDADVMDRNVISARPAARVPVGVAEDGQLHWLWGSEPKRGSRKRKARRRDRAECATA
jgi:hypothetical protein